MIALEVVFRLNLKVSGCDILMAPQQIEDIVLLINVIRDPCRWAVSFVDKLLLILE